MTEFCSSWKTKLKVVTFKKCSRGHMKELSNKEEERGSCKPTHGSCFIFFFKRSPCLEYYCSVQLSHSVMSDSLWPHGLKHARPPCSLPTHGIYSNSCPLSQWCHPTISSSAVPFPSCPQSFPASGAFQMSQFFPSGGQSIGVSASASVLPMNIQDWFPLGWTG